MMKAEELRLNNYVTIDNPNHHLKLKDVVLSVTGISPNTWRGKSTHAISLEHISQEENKYYETFSQFIKYIQPIELTEEWLIKIGLIKNCNLFEFSEEIQQSCLGDKGKNCPSVFFNKRLDRWMDPQTRVCFDYVHQLQNLYFALTGFELNIKS